MPGAETLPTVRLEVHQAGRTVPYWFDQVDFLIGTVPGCDLRVPGAALPAVLCLLARHPGGVHLRRLAATQVLLLNGISVSRADLQDGDRLSLGALDVYVRFEALAVAPVSAPPILPAPTLSAPPIAAPVTAPPVAAPVPVDDSRAELEAECERLRTELADRSRRQQALDTARADAERKFAAIVAERSADADALDVVQNAAEQRIVALKAEHEAERQAERARRGKPSEPRSGKPPRRSRSASISCSARSPSPIARRTPIAARRNSTSGARRSNANARKWRRSAMN